MAAHACLKNAITEEEKYHISHEMAHIYILIPSNSCHMIQTFFIVLIKANEPNSYSNSKHKYGPSTAVINSCRRNDIYKRT